MSGRMALANRVHAPAKVNRHDALQVVDVLRVSIRGRPEVEVGLCLHADLVGQRIMPKRYCAYKGINSHGAESLIRVDLQTTYIGY